MNDTIHPMNNTAPLIAPIFRSDTQGRILALLFSSPEQEITLSAIASMVGTSQATVWREIDRAQSAGLVVSRKAGQARLVRVDQTSRFFQPMRELVLGAFGAPVVISHEFHGVSGVDALMLFGSWVARYKGEPGKPAQDIDLLLIGEPNRHDTYEAASRAEASLGLSVQVTIRSLFEWANPDPFLTEVKSRPLITLKGIVDVPEVGHQRDVFNEAQ